MSRHRFFLQGFQNASALGSAGALLARLGRMIREETA